MTVLTAPQVYALALGAGLAPQQAFEATCVSFAESGFDTDAGRRPADHLNTNGSRDRGLWQLNDQANPQVTDAMAYGTTSAATEMARISGNGTNWRPWYAPWRTKTAIVTGMLNAAGGQTLITAHAQQFLSGIPTGGGAPASGGAIAGTPAGLADDPLGSAIRFALGGHDPAEIMIRSLELVTGGFLIGGAVALVMILLAQSSGGQATYQTVGAAPSNLRRAKKLATKMGEAMVVA